VVMQILVNGRSSGSVSIEDRGLQYGDGCFETIAIRQGAPLLWERHMARLFDSCKLLGIETGFDAGTLREEVGQLAKDRNRAVAKIIVTRGSGGRGYRSDPDQQATRIVSLHRWPQRDPAFYEHGIKLHVCRTRLSCNAALAGCKHLNRLEQIMARAEWADEYREGLMLDSAGEVIEGTMSNVFLQVGDEIVTPRLDHCGVRGVMRAEILDRLTDLGAAYRETTVDLDMIYKADAIFVSNSLIGLWPVKEIGRHQYPVTDLERRIQDTIHDVTVQ
jgi:4-amino-4-deoxychorismate lyase